VASKLADVTEANMHHIVGTHPILETRTGSIFFYNADKEGKLAFGVSSTLGCSRYIASMETNG